MFETTDIALALKRLAIAFVPLALGIILHEVAHGWMALRKGDMTAAAAGRLTLNPVPHVDPLGLFAFIVTSISSPFVFGWAKPVPVNYRNLHNPLRDMVWIAAAGPLSNLCLALLFALATSLLIWLFPPEEWYNNLLWTFASQMLPLGIGINCSLAWLNLLPIPPLDGSKIILGLLPRRWIPAYLSIERYGFIILLVLLITGLLGDILGPLIRSTIELCLFLVRLI